MTVAAVILSATADGALVDTLGQPRVRRLTDLAWSGGAMPIVVVAPDPDGAVAAALLGSEAVLGVPAAAEAGSVGQIRRGAELALGEVRDTAAVLIWPARMTWVGPETVTSLIEAHGTDVDAILRPDVARRAGLAGPATDDPPGRPRFDRARAGAGRHHRRTGPDDRHPRGRGRRPRGHP